MCDRNFFCSLSVVLCLFAGSVTAQTMKTENQNSNFVLSTHSITAKYAPTYLGNGNVGVSSSRLGTLPTHSYMAWIYEHHPGDVARNASLPGWDAINFFDGMNWLNSVRLSGKVIRRYHQRLDLYNGTLSTAYDWADGKKVTGIEVVSFVSRSNPNLAVMKFSFVPRYSGRVKVELPIHEWPEPVRMKLAEIADIKVKETNGWPDVWYPGHMNVVQHSAFGGQQSATQSVIARADGDTTDVAISAEVTWSDNASNAEVSSDTAGSKTSITVAFDVKAGSSYTFYKFVGIVSSRDSGDPLASASKTASSAMASGFDKSLNDSQDAWHKLWRTDIVVKGNPQLQKVVHSSLFYLLCSARAGTDFGIPPMGLSSAGYYGHIFWDSDTWMFPDLLLLHPDIAKSLVMFRYRALPAAEANAKLNHYEGAMYPWESDENGNEACPKFAYQNALYENHVTGDVAFAQWQYFLATGDTSWLRNYGYPVISQTADFWVSRSTYNQADGKYDINHVVSVDEGLVGVNNDAYTNLVAIRNLEIATKAAELLGERSNPKWMEVADRIYIPYDSTKHYYLTYEGAPPQSLGAVVPLLYYPLELKVPNKVKANDLRNALTFIKKNGSGVMMGITLYQNVAAEIQNRTLFNHFYEMSYKRYLRGPFNVFSETTKSMHTNFLTGAGGFLQQVVFGYTGLRITNKGLATEFKPMLPPGVSELQIHNLHFKGHHYDVTVKNDKTTLTER